MESSKINIAVVFLLKALIVRQHSKYVHRDLTLQDLKFFDIHPTSSWKYLGDGGTTRLTARPATYDRYLTKIKGFEGITFNKLQEIVEDDEVVKGFRDVKYKKMSQIPAQKIDMLKKWASNKADEISARKSSDFIKSEAHYLLELENLYKVYDLPGGCVLSREAIVVYPESRGILAKWILFHNRNKDWEYVKDEYLELGIETDKEYRSIYLLGIFEGALNQYAHKFTYTDDNDKLFKRLQIDKVKFLDNVYQKEQNGKYFYLLARYHVECWCSMPPKASKLTELIIALKYIKKSIELYEDSELKYGDKRDPPWWLFCYECIILKLIRDKSYEAKRKEYEKMIISIIEKDDYERVLQVSLQVYAVSNYLMIGNIEKLKTFFLKLKAAIERRKTVKKIKHNDMGEVDNFTYHHVHIIFHHQQEEIPVYHEILNQWFRS